jgi:hypothetical protein
MNLTLQDEQNETWKFSLKRVESSSQAPIKEKNARKAMLKLVDGILDNIQLRNLHKNINRLCLRGVNLKPGSNQTRHWIAQMYKGEEWFLVEKENISYYVSFDGIVQTVRPENCTVAWKVFVHQQPWFKQDTWVKNNFPMLSQTSYYATSIPALMEMEHTGIVLG